jgi:methyltransferase
MVKTLLWASVALLVAERAFELWLSARNAGLARTAGAIEHGRRHYPLVVALHTGWFVAWILEAYWRGPRLDSLWTLWAGLFVAGEALRYWCMATLGRQWNTRILVVPRRTRIRTGPYRLMNHPNYVGVAVFLFSVPMIFGAWVTALVASALNAALLLLLRIPAENRALKELGQA